MAKDYSELAESIVSLVGGKDNITAYAHCVTRLRFNVKDKGKVDAETVAGLANVLGTNWAAGNQFQVIIGQDVRDAYDLIAQVNGLDKLDAIDENLDADLEKRSFLDQIIDIMTGCFSPIVPLLMAAGLLKVILMVCSMTGILTADNTTYTILSYCADSAFYFLPIIVGGTTARHFGGNMGLGMLMGAILLHPTYEGIRAAGDPVTFFGVPVFIANYTSTVFPSVLGAFVMTKVEKFFGKHSPELLRSLLQPLCTVLVMIPLMVLLIGPLGSIVGTGVSGAIAWLYGKIGFLGVAIMCCLYPILVLTGMHRMFMPYQLQSFATFGYEPFYLPSAFISNINQGAATAVVALKAKDNDKIRTLAISSAFTALFAGITEPAMYGITTRYKKAMGAALVGNFVGGLVAGLLAVVCYAYPGSASFWGLPAFLGEKGVQNMVFEAVAMIIGAIVTFAVGMVIIKPEDIK